MGGPEERPADPPRRVYSMANLWPYISADDRARSVGGQEGRCKEDGGESAGNVPGDLTVITVSWHRRNLQMSPKRLNT